jgi:hypothetical protein
MMMLFRFEAIKPSEIEDNVFSGIEYPTNLKVTHEFEMDDATRWDNVMLQFAKFLDATGYVGVYEKVQQRMDDEWEFISNQFDEDTDEDTSNPGLSD